MVLSPGIRYMIIGTFMFTFMNMSIKMVSNIPTHEVLFVRSAVSFILAFSYIKYKGVYPWGSHKPVLLLRGIVGVTTAMLFIYMLQNMPIATAVTLQYVGPIFTAILASFLFAERIRWIQWVFFAISFAGVIVLKGFDTRISFLYLFLGLGVALSSAGTYNIIRYIKNSEHFMVVMMYFPLVAMPLTGIWCLFDWVQPSGLEWVFLVLTGVFAWSEQSLIAKSVQLEPLSRISYISYLSLIHALLIDVFFFGEHFNIATLSGMALVVGGVIFNLRRPNNAAVATGAQSGNKSEESP